MLSSELLQADSIFQNPLVNKSKSLILMQTALILMQTGILTINLQWKNARLMMQLAYQRKAKSPLIIKVAFRRNMTSKTNRIK